MVTQRPFFISLIFLTLIACSGSGPQQQADSEAPPRKDTTHAERTPESPPLDPAEQARLQALAALPAPLTEALVSGGVDGSRPFSESYLEQLRIDARIDTLLASMTVEDKVGQLIMLTFSGTEVTPGGSIERLLGSEQPGAIALFGQNLESTEQIARLTRQLRPLTRIPPFISTDQEGASVFRLRKPVIAIPSNMLLGAANDLDLTRDSGKAVGRDMWLMGFNMNLAPVLDVNTNPANPVISTRSFGADPELVSQHGVAFVQGMQSEKVAAVAKHFPGHGDTSSDSHHTLPVVDRDLKTLEATELAPFKAAIDHANLDAIMVAHIALPQVEGKENVPATVSDVIIGDILRGRLGYDGLIITDGLDMNAVRKIYPTEEAALMAFHAGADMLMLLWSGSARRKVRKALLKAIEDGSITGERLDASVRRILRVKIRRGILDEVPPDIESALAEITPKRNAEYTETIVRRGLTVARHMEGVTPIDTERYKSIVVVSAHSRFARSLRSRLKKRARVSVVKTSKNPSDKAYDKALKATRKRAVSADLVVVGIRGQAQAKMAQELAQSLDIPVLAVTFGAPYTLEQAPDADAFVCAFSYRSVAASVTADFLAGDFPATGTLPITLPTLKDTARAAP